MTARRTLCIGVGLIEVLVALVIIAIGLLGLAATQVHAQKVELEAHQRSQAMTLVSDMASRIRANPTTARCYVTAGYIGQAAEGEPESNADPVACSGWGTIATRSLADRDRNDWDGLLEGSAALRGTEAIGAMDGARGCVTYDTSTEEYTVAVAWQGEVVTKEPANTCADGVDYGGDGLRRVVTTLVRIPELD